MIAIVKPANTAFDTRLVNIACGPEAGQCGQRPIAERTSQNGGD